MKVKVYTRWPYRTTWDGKVVPNTCRCGCEGKDSLHAVKIPRVVRNVRKEAGTAEVSGIYTALGYDAVGEITYAGETSRVVRICGAWYVSN